MQHALLLVGSSGARLSADAKAARDDCGGFLFGSAVLAEVGDHAARAAAGGRSMTCRDGRRRPLGERGLGGP